MSRLECEKMSGSVARYERYRKGPRTPRSAHARYYYTRSLLEPPVKRRPSGPSRMRCQSAPRVMDSHSRSASPREPMRPQHRPPSPPASPGAFDNRAYQHDDADPNHNDSFTSNTPGNGHQNGHSKEPNGDTKLPEAVNLELINLTPKNGSKKKDVEVDMNASNPYDEYFVPVNEHRKFMRGEKLYVTADKRGEKSGCKRPLCWTMLVLVVAAIVALIVLAATGILFSSSPTTLEQYNTSISSARALGGIGGHTHDHDHDHHDHDHSQHDHDHGQYDHDHSQHDHDHSQNEHDHSQHDHDHTQHDYSHDMDATSTEATVQQVSDTQNDAPLPNVSDDNDMSMYVPRTVEGELTIDNEDFTPALEDPDSADYREFVATFTDGLKKALFDRYTLENGDNDISIEVVKLQKGSVVVTYRIHWKPKSSTENTEDVLTAKSLKMKLNEYLDNSNRMINVYHVYEGNMSTKPVLDICQIDKNHCEYGCEFDESTLEFTCTCPHGQILDMSNQKKCIAILENSYPLEPNQDTEHKEIKVMETDENPMTTKSVPEDEKPITESVHVSKHDQKFDWIESKHDLPETTTHPDADVNFSHIFGHGNHNETEVPAPEPSAEPNAEPEPTAEPKPEPKLTAELEAAPEPKPEPAVEPEPEPTAEPKSEPEPTAESNAKPSAEPNSEPEPTAEPKAEPEPNAEPEPTAEPKAEAEPTTELKAEPESKIEPEQSINLKLEHEVEPEPTAEPKSEPEPAPEPKAEPELTTEPTSESKAEPESTAEQKTEMEPIAEPKAEPEPTSEPKPEPEPTTKLEPEHTAEGEEEFKPDMFSHVASKPIMHDEREEPDMESEHESITEVIKMEASTERDPGIVSLEVISIHPKTREPELTTTTESKSPETTNDSVEFHQIMDQPHTNTMHITSQEQVTAAKEESERQVERDIKPTNEIESTTLRVSISEPHIINEPSYEPKPEIISILSENKEAMPKFVTEENNEQSTEHSEWLQYNPEKVKTIPSEEQKGTQNDYHDSEQRSFKSIDIFAEDTTTETVDEQVSMSDNTTESENKEQSSETTISPISKNDEDEKVVNNTEISDVKSKDDANNVTSEATINENSSDLTEKNERSPVTVAMHEGRSLGSIETTTSAEISDLDKELYTIGNFSSVGVEKHLMEALGNINETVTEPTTTKKMTVDDSMDITFDAINMLYNRSSHAVDNDNSTYPTITEGYIEATTVSDWLSEPVSEIKFDEAMNKHDEKHETTETSHTKIDEIINTGITKDDFEPDYLNNMSSNQKMKEELPMYGISPDYDTEDARVKRVNVEKGMSTQSMSNEPATTENILPSVDKTKESNTSLVSLETTTIIDYIYKNAEKAMQNTLEVSSSTNAATTSTEKSEPAPVWEDSESDKDLTVKELVKPAEVAKENPTTVKTESGIMTTTSSSSISDASVVSAVSESTPDVTTVNSIQEVSTSESNVESQTKVNNLNVTIYEIPSHNRNTAVTNQHSNEFEDHETEMNPFLPEIENNKSLVKKLQEGHDIEPTNFNETQNENVDEHSNNTSETKRIMDSVNSETKTDEDKSTVTVALTTEGSTPVLDNVTPRMSKEIPESKTPISTFLLDTDDLDGHKTTIAENKLEAGATPPSPSSPLDLNDESDYLSVVPIEEERLEENESLKKDYGSELNDISDSPKKSNRRTLEETKFDSVNDNEA